MFYAGYTIVVTLLPGGSSANAVMRHAADLLKGDPDVVSFFGSVKCYGEDFGARAEGRRYFVPEYTYTDPWSGVEYHRVRFNLEGDRGRKATVWAEVSTGTYEFRYLVVLTKDRTRVWSLIDKRTPPPTLEARKADLSGKLREGGWSFAADAESDVAAQRAELGDFSNGVQWVVCSTSQGGGAPECEAGAPRPAWRAGPGGATYKGMLTLEGLEAAQREVAKAESERWLPKWARFW